jgi:hypothetical protein
MRAGSRRGWPAGPGDSERRALATVTVARILILSVRGCHAATVTVTAAGAGGSPSQPTRVDRRRHGDNLRITEVDRLRERSKAEYRRRGPTVLFFPELNDSEPARPAAARPESRADASRQAPGGASVLRTERSKDRGSCGDVSAGVSHGGLGF